MTGAMLTVGIEDEATRHYAALADRLGATRGLMDAIGAELVSSTLRRFSESRGPDGKAWAPLAKSTLKKRGASAKPLMASGRLRLSITRAASTSQVEVGSNLIYAALMQMGGTVEHAAHSAPVYRTLADLKMQNYRFAKRSKADVMTYHEVKDYSITIPGRPYLGVSAEDRAAVARIAHEYVMGTKWS